MNRRYLYIQEYVYNTNLKEMGYDFKGKEGNSPLGTSGERRSEVGTEKLIN